MILGAVGRCLLCGDVCMRCILRIPRPLIASFQVAIKETFGKPIVDARVQQVRKFAVILKPHGAV